MYGIGSIDSMLPYRSEKKIIQNMEVNMTKPEHDKLSQETVLSKNEKGRLKIYFGYAAGVGKTYAMLDDQRAAKTWYIFGSRVHRISYPPETLQLLEELPVLPIKIEKYKNMELTEFDIGGALKRNQNLLL